MRTIGKGWLPTRRRNGGKGHGARSHKGPPLPVLLHCVVTGVMLFRSPACGAQGPAQDTLYVRDLSQRVTLRVYASHKFNSMVVRSSSAFHDLRYRPNGQINIGLGASLRKLTLNIGVRMPFVNDDADRKGRTRFLDAQANIHGPRQATNLFLQVYRGYHITSHDRALTGWEQPTAFPYRADLSQFNIGLSSLRVLNSGRFSYRAGFNQDAVQLRSQGSWLVGGYATGYVLRADSALVPSRLSGQFPLTADIRRGTFLDIGPMGGYAYTRVFGAHWFVTGSAALGVGLSAQLLALDTQAGPTRTRDLGPGWHVQFRFATGYNSRKHYYGIVFNQEHVGHLLRSQQRFAWDVGVARLVFAQRFRERPKALDRGTRWFNRKKRAIVP